MSRSRVGVGLVVILKSSAGEPAAKFGCACFKRVLLLLLLTPPTQWSDNLFLLRGYLDMCNLLDGLVALAWLVGCCMLSRCLGPGECLHSFISML